MPSRPPQRPRSDSRRPKRARVRTLGLLLVGAASIVAFNYPAAVAALVLPRPAPPDAAIATPEAAGISHAVDLTVALPGDPVRMPMAIGPDSAGLRYEWVAVGDTVVPAYSLPFDSARLYAPATPGFYHLALVRDTAQTVLDTPTLAVMVPFDEERGGEINGYRIGTYRGERHAGDAHPEGFLAVEPQDVDLPVSAHLRVSDFITHDAQQDRWPKYVALRPRLLDKIELVLAELQRATGRSTPIALDLDVHSGFRTPLYNRTVPRAADDSRHQYGDAADIALDANGDGRIDARDVQAIAEAVDRVEAMHPELTGGLGLYTSRRYPTPYVHIDTRGERKRWRG